MKLPIYNRFNSKKIIYILIFISRPKDKLLHLPEVGNIESDFCSLLDSSFVSKKQKIPEYTTIRNMKIICLNNVLMNFFVRCKHCYPNYFSVF